MAIPNIAQGQIALDSVSGIFYYIDSNGNLVNSSLKLLQSSESTISTQDGLSVGGNLTVSGDVVTVNTETLTIEDANIELGTVASPSNITANGGGMILKGTTDKTFLWSNATNSWTSSENIDIAPGKSISVGSFVIYSDGTFRGGLSR
jgi:hypothetical protein